MKTKSIYETLYGLIKPGTLAAVAMVSGFWASLAFAMYFVSGAVGETQPKLLGLLFFALFAVFFLLHSFGPWSKWAAVLGFCSLAVLTASSIYLNSPVTPPSVMIVMLVIVFATVSALAGVLLDAGKYLQWSAWGNNHTLNLRNPVLVSMHRTVRPDDYAI